MTKHSVPSTASCQRTEKEKIIRRTAVPFAVLALCCGMSGTEAAAAVCGPGRSLPVNTWLMTAPSCNPSPADLVSQYGDDIPSSQYGTNWIAYKWTPVGQSYGGSAQAGTEPLVLGTGNWLYSLNAGTLFLSGMATPTEPCSNYGSTDLAGNCFAIDLTPSDSDIWQIVGNPFPYTVDWPNVRVASFEGGTWTQRTPSEAADAAVNLMAKEFWYWNGNAYDTKDDSTPQKIGALKPQESVWVRIRVGSNSLSGFKLLIPTLLIPPQELNDTGITWSGNYASGNNATCVASNTPDGDNVVAAQDCSHGRDTTHNDDSDGLAGFSYTKLDSNGQPLPQDAASWACVQDNVTGLIWEVKTDNTPGDLHDKDDTYTWYNTDTNTNGGADGEENVSGNTCFGWSSGDAATYCNTQAYVSRVKTENLCGFNDWRMPTLKELESLVNYGRSNPAIDTSYFPNAVSFGVCSSSPFAAFSDSAWRVNFDYGSSLYGARDSNFAVRLVRGGQ